MGRILILSLLCIGAIAQDRGAEAWKVLEDGLSDERNSERRARAALALGLAGGVKGRKLAEGSLSDANPEVRVAAVQALAEMDARAAIPKIKAALDDEDAGVVFAAAQALWDLGDRSSRGVLTDVALGERPGSGGEFMGKYRKRSTLIKIGSRQGASILLGPFSMPFFMAAELMKDHGAAARAVAADALAEDRDPRSIKTLEQAAFDTNWAVRVTALRALAHRRAGGSIPTIAPAMYHSNETVRFTAAAAVIRIGAKRAR